MSQTIKNEAGEDVEVFSTEELEAQKQEAIEAYKAENPDKTDDLTALQEELQKKEEELKGLKDKDVNFSKFKSQKDKEIETIKKEIDEKIVSVKKEVMEGVMKDHYNDTLKVLAGGDEEAKKKIEFHFKRLGDVAGTKEEITNKLKDAYILANKPADIDALNTSVISSGGVGRINVKVSETKLTPEEKELGKKLGLSDEDYKKYSK